MSDDLFDLPPDPASEADFTITVHKFGAALPVSCCMLADAGGSPCDHPARPPLPRRKRVRWAITNWWYRNRPHMHRGPCPVEEDW